MKKILLIDDDPDLREVMNAVLSPHYDLELADSKEAGYKMLENSIPDLIVLDVMMESYDSGFEMCRELKNSDKYKDIRILILTSVDKRMNIDFKAEAGDPDWLPADDYISKPVEPKELLEKVENLLT